MAKKKKKEEVVVVLDKENLLYQPYILTKLGMDMNLIQRKTFIAFIRKLQHNIKEIRKARYDKTQLSLFDTIDQRTKILGEDAIELATHPRDIGIHPNNYNVAFETILKMEHIRINMPLGNGNFLRVPMFYIIVTPNLTMDENGNPCGYNRDPTIHFAIKRNELERFFDDNKNNPIMNYLDYTASSIQGTYTLAIYQWLSKFKYEDGPIRESLAEVRRIMGIVDYDDKGNLLEERLYPRFSDLKKGTLMRAKTELDDMCETGEADFSFDFEPEYLGSKRAPNPDYLIFTINLSNVGENIRSEKKDIIQTIGIERQLADRLRNDFDQSSAQITRIIKTLPSDRVGDFLREMDSLARLIADKKVEIKKDLRSYANRIFTDTITALIEANSKLVKNTPSDASVGNSSGKNAVPNKAETVTQEPPAPVIPQAPAATMSEEDMKKWHIFIEHISKNMKEQTFNIWIKPCTPLSLVGNKLAIWVPTKFFYEYIEDVLIEPFSKAIFTAFGEGTKLEYKVGM